MRCMHQPAWVKSTPNARLPARTRWLKGPVQLLTCPPWVQEFAVVQDVAPHGAVMIFPAAYLNSRRVRAHTLLRIDQADVQKQHNTRAAHLCINPAPRLRQRHPLCLEGLMGGVGPCSPWCPIRAFSNTAASKTAICGATARSPRSRPSAWSTRVR